MAIALDHTIVYVTDRERAATFVTEVLGLPDATSFGHFLVVTLANGVSLDYLETQDDFDRQHYAFMVGDDDFAPIFDRIVEGGIEYWADPGCTRPGEINHRDGGRGVYFADPDGHLLEIITRPYGSGD